MICALCDHTATRKVGHTGYCEWHKADAFAAQAIVVARLNLTWGAYEDDRKAKDYRDLGRANRRGYARLHG